MNLNDTQNLRPLRNLVAFVWIKPVVSQRFIIPESIYDLKALPGQTEGIRVGNFYIGRVLAPGPKIDDLKKDDLIIVHEFGIKNYSGTWKENEIYFIESEFILCKFLPKENGKINVERIRPGKREIERMMKKIEEETTKEDSKNFESQVRRKGLDKGL